MLHKGVLVNLDMPDLTYNARERRGKTKKHRNESQPDITTAAEKNFNRDYRPIVDPDGGFTNKPEERKQDDRSF